MSEQPMLLLLLLSIYLLQRGKISLSAVSFAAAVLFKQEALLLAPIYFLFMYKDRGKKNLAKFAGIFAGIFGAASLPFLIITPIQYFAELTVGAVIPYHPAISLPSSIVTGWTAVTTSVLNPVCNAGGTCTAFGGGGGVFTILSTASHASPNLLAVPVSIVFIGLLVLPLYAFRRSFTMSSAIVMLAFMSILFALGDLLPTGTIFSPSTP